MIKTKTKILIIISFILLITNIFTCIIKKQATEKLISELVNPKEKQNIYKIKITVPSNSNQTTLNSLTFKKSENDFIFETSLGTYKLKNDVIDNLINSLITKTQLTKITSKPKNFSKYGFSDNHYASIKLENKNGQLIANLNFGKIDTLGSNIYIKTNTTNIYKTKDIYSKFLTLKTHFWLDLQIYKNTFSKTSLQGITINNKFYIVNEKNQTEINLIQKALTSFTCIGIYYGTFPETPTTKEIILSLGNNKTIELKYTKIANGDYAVTDNQNKNIYIASNYAISKIEEIIYKIERKN